MTARWSALPAILAWSLAAWSFVAWPLQAASIHVVSQSAAQLARIEIPGKEVVRTRALPPAPAVVAADERGHLYVSHPDSGAISVVEAGAGEARRLPYRGQAFGIAVEPDGRSVYVGDWSAHRVSRLSAETGAVEASVEVGKDPAHLVLDRAGRLFVADRESHQVSVIDTARMKRIATIPVGTAPFALGLNPKQDRLYVANVRSNDLTVIDTGAMNAIATVPVGAMPYGVATSLDGTRVAVTNQHAGTVTILDGGSLQRIATVKVGQYPEGIAVAGGLAYVANWFSDDVSIIDFATLTETGRIKVGEGPRSLVVEGGPEAVR